MPEELIKKQVHAKIDGRTTVICLHAAGQIRPVALPYETLNGPYMRPPFHVHCRSLSVPWMPGFVNPARKEANLELRKRPARIRKMADGRVPNRIPPPADAVPMAPDPKSPAKRVKATPKKAAQKKKTVATPAVQAVGKPITAKDRPAEQISDPDEAAQYLARRGPLEDVEDRILRQAILRVPDRFEVTKLGGGVSNSYTVKDSVTGEQWAMKSGDFAGDGGRSKQREDVNEFASSFLARRWGLTAPEVRFAGDEWILMRWADQPGKIAEHGAFRKKFPGQSIDKSWIQDVGHTGAVDLDPIHQEAMRSSIFDFLIDNQDRHGGNYLIMDDRGTPRISLIDHGLAFDGRDRQARDRGIHQTFEEYQKTGSNGPGKGGFSDLLRNLIVNGPKGQEAAAKAGYDWLDDIADDIESGSFADDLADEIGTRIGLGGLDDVLDFIREMVQTRYDSALDALLDSWAIGRFR